MRSVVPASKYRILGLIGQGQFGRVYCALHRKTGQLVALKSLDCDRFPTHQFLRELRFLLSLQHPNIVSCKAIEHIQGGRYLVMDYCEGGTLRSLMENHDRLHPALSVKLVADVLSGIEHAHQRGIVHCDIKPENILLTIHSKGWTARLSDFGIARLSQELNSDDANITGSPAYMAPERFYGQYSHSTDLYAIGILLFELLVGHRPFSGSPMELMAAHLNHPVQIPDSVPAALQPIVLTALQKLKARRFQSATAMLKALEGAIAQCPELRLTPVLAKPAVPDQRSCVQLLREEVLRHGVEHLASTDYFPVLEPRGMMRRMNRYLRQSSLLILTERLKMPLDQSSFGTQVWSRQYSGGVLSTRRQQGEELPVMSLPEPIETLVVRSHAHQSQVCYGIAARSLYLLSDQAPKRLIRFHQPSFMSIDPSGRWMAVAAAQEKTGILSVWKLPQPRLIQPPTMFPQQEGTFFQLLAIDARHIALFSHLPGKTHLKLFNRRGQILGDLCLPIEFKTAIALKCPYQLAAIDPNFPKSLLLLQLKPLKITRVTLAIAPQFLAAFPWGMAAVDALGRIVMLDLQGQLLGQDEILGQVCAVAALGESGLAIATWQHQQGKLYTLNLQNRCT